MKNAKVGTKKIVKDVQPRRVAGVPVRSGVKAGMEWSGQRGDREFGTMRGGEFGRRPG
jgi:hypothetical protein